MSLENAGKGNPAALCVCVGFINTTAKPGAVWTTDIATVTSQVALSFKMRSPSWLQKTACDKVRWVWLWNNCGWPVGSQWTSWTIPLLSLHFQTLLKIYKNIFIFFIQWGSKWVTKTKNSAGEFTEVNTDSIFPLRLQKIFGLGSRGFLAPKLSTMPYLSLTVHKGHEGRLLA